MYVPIKVYEKNSAVENLPITMTIWAKYENERGQKQKINWLLPNTEALSQWTVARIKNWKKP